MNRIGVVAVVVIVTSVVFLPGCGPKKGASIGTPIEPNPAPAMSGDAGERIDVLRQQVAAFDAARQNININTPGDGRRQIAAALGALSQVLTTLEGPEPGGAFRQQVRIIDTNRARLTEGSADLAAEPTINAALRAASRALERIGAELFPEDAELRELLDRFRGRVDELDTVRGPLHRLVVTQALASASEVTGRMAGVLEQRMGGGRGEEPPAPAPEPAQAVEPSPPQPPQ